MEISPKLATAGAGVGTGSALAIVLVWLLGLAGIQMPTEVAMALSSILATLLGGWLGWLVPHRASELPS